MYISALVVFRPMHALWCFAPKGIIWYIDLLTRIPVFIFYGNTHVHSGRLWSYQRWLFKLTERLAAAALYKYLKEWCETIQWLPLGAMEGWHYSRQWLHSGGQVRRTMHVMAGFWKRDLQHKLFFILLGY